METTCPRHPGHGGFSAEYLTFCAKLDIDPCSVGSVAVYNVHIREVFAAKLNGH